MEIQGASQYPVLVKASESIKSRQSRQNMRSSPGRAENSQDTACFSSRERLRVMSKGIAGSIVSCQVNSFFWEVMIPVSQRASCASPEAPALVRNCHRNAARQSRDDRTAQRNRQAPSGGVDDARWRNEEEKRIIKMLSSIA
jgi:hypothetical protein